MSNVKNMAHRIVAQKASVNDDWEVATIIVREFKEINSNGRLQKIGFEYDKSNKKVNEIVDYISVYGNTYTRGHRFQEAKVKIGFKYFDGISHEEFTVDYHTSSAEDFLRRISILAAERLQAYGEFNHTYVEFARIPLDTIII